MLTFTKEAKRYRLRTGLSAKPCLTAYSLYVSYRSS